MIRFISDMSFGPVSVSMYPCDLARFFHECRAVPTGPIPSYVFLFDPFFPQGIDLKSQCAEARKHHFPVSVLQTPCD
jgi:hypothetical protein